MVTLSFTLPVSFSVFRFLPVALISGWAAPALTTLLLCAWPADEALTHSRALSFTVVGQGQVEGSGALLLVEGCSGRV